jgi:hypothetical protein
MIWNHGRLPAQRMEKMWRFLRRHFMSVGALGGAIAFAFYVLPLPCEAQTPEEQIARIGQADHSVVIREHAGWDMECAAIAHPPLYLKEPPRHGSVCARIQDIRIRSMFVGTQSQCIGRVVRGVQLVYRPDAGYVGEDRLRYAAKYPAVLRPVSVLVTVTPDPFATSGAEPSSLSAPTPARQAPGQIPACEDLVF